MQGAGFNVSREVLLALRQGNQQRVEHLVAGFVAALRLQRTSSGHASSGALGSPATGDEGSPSDLWGPGISLGTSTLQFAFAVQRLSRMSLGPQHGPFWDEVSGFVAASAGKLDPQELALICNAYASGAPERLPGKLGGALLSRAAELAGELGAKDLTMVAHGLARAVSTG